MKQNMNRRYFRTVRLRSGLTQSDVAFLMGWKQRNLISLLESRAREPSLNAIVGYRVIFGSQLRDLMPGRICDVRRSVKCRARMLLPQLKALPQSKIVQARVQMIERIIKNKKLTQRNEK